MFKKLKSQVQEADGDLFTSPNTSIRRSSSNNLESPSEYGDKIDCNRNIINENVKSTSFKEFDNMDEYNSDDNDDQISILEHKLNQLEAERTKLEEQNELNIEKNRMLMEKNNQMSNKVIELKAQLERIEADRDRMKIEYEESQAKLKEELDQEKLINEHSLENLKNKLAESVMDYRTSIDKYKQRQQKLKKKLNHSITTLTLIDRILFSYRDEETILTKLIKNLSQKSDSDVEDEMFDEDELKQLVYEKQAEFESLKEEVEMNRAKLKEEKKKLIGEKQSQLDDLQDRLTNLDLKYKQIKLDGNLELQEAKKKISALEDELKKMKNDKEKLTSQLKTEEKEKNMAVLELPSMKARLAEIETEHEKKLNDELKFKQQYYEAVMSEIEENHRREMEANRKRIDRLKTELNEPEKTRESRLRAECEKLRKQLDELNYFYGNLMEEKSQLIALLNELKQKKDRFLYSSKLEQSLNEFKSSLDSCASLKNHSMTLEAAEMHYLRKVVYSYMMGIDPNTMANVIVTILRFSDDEKQRLIENEKMKCSSSGWFS